MVKPLEQIEGSVYEERNDIHRNNSKRKRADRAMEKEWTARRRVEEGGTEREKAADEKDERTEGWMKPASQPAEKI